MPYTWTPPGAMRQSCTILAPAAGQDGMGQPITNWTPLYTSVPCKATIRGGSENFAEQHFQPRIMWELRMRYAPGITALNGILLGSDGADPAQHFLDVQTVEDIEYRHRELLLTCLERLNYQEYGDST